VEAEAAASSACDQTAIVGAANAAWLHHKTQWTKNSQRGIRKLGSRKVSLYIASAAPARPGEELAKDVLAYMKANKVSQMTVRA
jgi:hypothetical protein